MWRLEARDSDQGGEANKALYDLGRDALHLPCSADHSVSDQAVAGNSLENE